MFQKAVGIFDIEQQLEWAAKADEIVADAAQQEGVVLPELLAQGIAACVKVHKLSQPGVFTLVEAYANSERQAGRLAIKPATDFSDIL